MTTVTDADRDAAADYFELTNDALRADFARGGKYDMSVCVQAFARHREAEVVKIVAWLKKENGLCDCNARSPHECACGAWDDYKTWPLERVWALIEAGEYRNDA